MPSGKKAKKHKAGLKKGKKLQETKPLSLYGHVVTGTHIKTGTIET